MKKIIENLLQASSILLLALIMTIQLVNAQDGDLGDEQINVVKPYQPTLSDAHKINDNPRGDTTVVFVPELDYSVEHIQHPTVYTISPIKAVRMKDENIKELYRGFVKAGYGTKNTPMGELFFNSLRSKEFDAGLHINHISSSGKIKDFGHPGMSESGIDIFGKRFLKDHTVGLKVGYDRYLYHYYGYKDPPDIFSKSETKHSFDDIHARLFFNSNEIKKDKFRYSTYLDFYNISDNKDHKETSFLFHSIMAKQINEGEAFGNIELDILNYDTPLESGITRNIYRIEPRYRFEFSPLIVTVGINLHIDDNEDTEVKFFPHARADYNVIDKTMTIFGQITGNIERRSFRSASMTNPFMEGPIDLINSVNKFDLSGGMSIKLDKQLLFILKGGVKRFDDDMFFYNLPPESPTTMVKYDVIFADNTTTYLQAEVTYEQYDHMGISLLARYNGNNSSRLDKPLFRPKFNIVLKGNYNMADKIRLSTEWFFNSEQNAWSHDENNFRTVKGYVDGSVTIDYIYSKVFTVFLSLNNITASSYSRWYQYPSYRFMAIGGLTYSF